MKILLSLLISIIWFYSIGQDSLYTRNVIDTLCSKYMEGRGYTNDGHIKAAHFLSDEFERIGIPPYPGQEYFQEFQFDINTFPNELALKMDDNKLIAALDYLVLPYSGSANGDFETITIKHKKYLNPKKFIKEITKPIYNGKVLMIDKDQFEAKDKLAFRKIIEILRQYEGFQFSAVIILADDKLTSGLSRTQNTLPFVQIQKKGRDFSNTKTVHLNIKNEFKENLTTQNVIGFLKGKGQSDSVIIICGHYDHLGAMGTSAYFPGANDNASGTSMLLNLAKYYKEHPQNHSIMLIAFGAEEAGLVGSYHYVRNPFFPLPQIKFVINMDLFGTGSEGIMAVNGKVHQHQFNWLTGINTKHSLLPIVKKRGQAANSDHHYFTENAVPGFFLYTMGGIQAYHDIYDIPETLPLTKYKEVYQLIIHFIEKLQVEAKTY